MISKCVELMDKRDSLNLEVQRMNVLCKGSVKKQALGQCVRNQASQHWEQSVGQRGLGRVGAWVGSSSLMGEEAGGWLEGGQVGTHLSCFSRA